MITRKTLLFFSVLFLVGQAHGQTRKLLEFNSGVTDFMVKLIDYEEPLVAISYEEKYKIPGYFSLGLVLESETQPDVYLGAGIKFAYLTKEITAIRDSTANIADHLGSYSYSHLDMWQNEYTFMRLELPVYLRTRLFYAGLQITAYLSKKNAVVHDFTTDQPGIESFQEKYDDDSFNQRTLDVALLMGTKIKLSQSLLLDIKADIGLARNELGYFDTKYRVNSYSLGLSYLLNWD